MKKLSQEFLIFDDSTLNGVLTKLENEFGDVLEKPEGRVRRVYYDTFDWRLYLGGYSLAVENRPSPGRSALRNLASGSLILHAPRPVERFAWENPPGPLGEFLTELIGIRGLLPLVELRSRIQTYSVRDKRGKVLVVLVRERAAAAPFKGDAVFDLKPRLRLEGVRGYEEAMTRALSVVKNEGIQGAEENIFDEALKAVSLEVEKYQPKPTLPLDPNMPAIAAMTAILLHLRQVMEINLPGTILDLDSEFLHDFRVAVRRTRSALGQIKGIFPEASIRPFRDEFKWLGNITGPTRDLDVYLLKFPSYCRELPEAIRPDLEPLEEFLKRHQLQEQKILTRFLKSARLRRLLDSWQEYLETCADSAGLPPAATTAIGELARNKIAKTYRKFAREGSRIEDDSPDEALHRLRITGKKLRYLLEFFQALFPQEPMSRLVKEMKMVQDFLGDFQDLTVQQQQLGRFGEKMKEEKDIPAATLLAMGRLMEDMERRQKAMRPEFRNLFRAFSGGDAGRLFEKLFVAPKGNVE